MKAAKLASASASILYGMYRVFAAFQAKDAFALPVVKTVRLLGIMIVVHTLIALSFDPVMHAALTYDSPPGHRLFVVSANTYHARALLMGALFLLIGHIFTQAVHISDENRQIV